jgi:nucleotide-binding universal stress UspA family protein
MTRATHDRPAPPAPAPVAHDVRPVMLLTLNVPLDEEAVEFAIDTAAETGAALYICDAIPLEYRNYVGHVARQYAEQLNRKHLDAVARLARERGVRTTQLAFHNPKPVKAAIEVAQSERVGLLVFGPDRKRIGRWTFRRATKRLREEATCLVWTNEL